LATGSPRRALYIGEAARLVGVSVKALRLYERLGLLGPTLRTDAGYRVYSAADLTRLRQIRWARSLDLRLREVREFLGPTGSKNPSVRQRPEAVLEARLLSVREEMQRLRDVEGRLLEALASTASSTSECGGSRNAP
jgi:MerR family Zn(II)-responsive transcriptional regulator of zntA